MAGAREDPSGSQAVLEAMVAGPDQQLARVGRLERALDIVEGWAQVSRREIFGGRSVARAGGGEGSPASHGAQAPPVTGMRIGRVVEDLSEELPASARSLLHERFAAVRTCGDVACAVHAVFGSVQNGELRCEGARELLHEK